MKNWININSFLPQVNHPKLLCSSNGNISTGCLSKRRPTIEWNIHDEEIDNFEVQYWMNLPDDPISSLFKSEENEKKIIKINTYVKFIQSVFSCRPLQSKINSWLNLNRTYIIEVLDVKYLPTNVINGDELENVLIIYKSINPID